MSDQIAPLKARLTTLREVRAELESIRKEAFMAAPPMPGGAPPMDPAMMQGGMPPGMPVDPNTGMPMDPAMMQGGMPPGPPVDPNTGMPMDPAMMQGGMPPGPPVDPNTGMPMDPAAMGGAPPQEAGQLTPEMVEELLGVIEELAAGAEKQEAINQELMQNQEELAAQLDDLNRRLSVEAVTPA